MKDVYSELRRCVKVEVAVRGSPFITQSVTMVSVDLDPNTYKV